MVFGIRYSVSSSHCFDIKTGYLSYLKDVGYAIHSFATNSVLAYSLSVQQVTASLADKPPSEGNKILTGQNFSITPH